MKKYLISLLVGCCLAVSAGNTFIPDMKFRRLDTRDGLSNSTINYLFQDSKGYVWIGTSYGLNRYDGYRFRTFYSDPNDTTTLRNNYVDQIFEDAACRPSSQVGRQEWYRPFLHRFPETHLGEEL